MIDTTSLKENPLNLKKYGSAHCLKCSHSWVKLSSNPEVCPACNSRNWNNPNKNEYDECKNNGCYLFFDDKKAILLDTIENELAPQEIFINALYYDYDRRAKFVKIDIRDAPPPTLRLLHVPGASSVLFDLAERHKKEAKYIFEVWNFVESCIVCKNYVLERGVKEK